jgi:hypothetical protein
MIFLQMQWLKVREIMGERLNLLVAERVGDVCHRRDAPADAQRFVPLLIRRTAICSGCWRT